MPQHSPGKRGEKTERMSETEIEEFLECFRLEDSLNVLSFTLSLLGYAGLFTIFYSLIIRKRCPAAVHVRNGILMEDFFVRIKKYFDNLENIFCVSFLQMCAVLQYVVAHVVFRIILLTL